MKHTYQTHTPPFSELIGFWPLNCDYLGRDLSNYALNLNYNPELPTAPRFECEDDEGLRGRASFGVSGGDLVSIKYLEVRVFQF